MRSRHNRRVVFPCGVWLTVGTTPLTPILLTPGPTLWAEAQAKREIELTKLLARLAVTRAEMALFLTVNYGSHHSPSGLPRNAVGEGGISGRLPKASAELP